MIWKALGAYQGPSSAKVLVRYMEATLRREIIERTFRVYVTDSLNGIPEHKHLTYRWYDLFYGNDATDDWEPEEVIDAVVSRLDEEVSS